VHRIIPGHFLPQIPQLAGSFLVFTHCPLQAELPAAQVTPHWLSEHVATPPGTMGHILLQLPQLFRSVRGSMQLMPQRIIGLWHSKSHLPPLQTGAALGGGMHTMLHAPQLDVSEPVSTHDAPHVVLLPQSAMHTPLWQTEPLAHTVPHAPQCAESEVSSTQGPLQLL
jgi:hypothetical protein